MAQTKTTKPPESWLRRNKLDPDKARARSTVKPALLAMAGAVAGGGIASAIPPLASGIGGAACIFAGIYSGKAWLATAGAAMLTSTAHLTLGGAGLRTTGGGTDMKTVLEGGKERITAFGKAFAGKFIPLKEDAGQALSGLGDPHMLLDDIERSVEASALEHKSAMRALPGTLPGFNRY
jgi:hypothetical protein